MQQPVYNYKKIRSQLFLKYQMDLDETSCSILFVLLVEQKKHFEEQSEQLKETTRKINASNSSLQVDSKKPGSQAFWFGMGKWGLALIIATSIAAGFYSYHLSDEAQNSKTAELLKWYETYYQVSQRESKKAVTDFLNKYPMPQQ